jgi:hypothetical protein
MNRWDEEGNDGDYGQVDGDEGPQPVANFAPNTAQPWLRSGIPPWHLWGNTQKIDITIQTLAAGVPALPSAGQLVKIAYKRPESWNWILSARLLSGPVADFAGITITVLYDLTIGIGRSTIQMQNIPNAIFASKSFEMHQFVLGVGDPFPIGAQIWTTQSLAPSRNFRTDFPFGNTTGNAVPPDESASVVDRIVAQDIQLSCRVYAITGISDVALGQPVQVEVSAQFAPASHVRPDWYRQGPEEVSFPGEEVEGR